MVDREVISRKLSRRKTYLGELRRARDITWQRYETDVRSRAFVERYVHLAIESGIDIANHFVSFYGRREPAGCRDLFAVLAERGVIPAEELETFQRMASVRNLLVHPYERIDDEVVYGIFANRLDDFDRFAEPVEAWTTNRNPPPGER
ncbi:MAG: hypothetical protein Kow0092_26530 [Deferrisomatales bacterium]